MKRLGHALEKIDERIPGIDLPLMSVSQTRGVIRRSELTDMPQRAESLDEYKVCREGDIVFNKMKIRSGAMGVAPEDGLVTYHYEVMRLRDGMDARYIVYLMKSSWFTSELIARERGISAGGEYGGIRTTEVPFKVLRTIEVRLPEVCEQQQIADYLDRETARIETLIGEQQRLIEMLRERRAAVLSSALSPADLWVRCRIKHIGETQLGKMLDAGRAVREADEPRPYVRAADIRADGSVNLVNLNKMPFSDAEMEMFDLRAGDILLIEGGAAGRPGFMFESAPGIAFQKTVIRLRVGSDVDARFVYWSMLRIYDSAYYVNHYGSVSFIHLTGEKLREIELHLPTLDEQRLIAGYLDEQTAKIDALIAETERFIELARERRSALITAAVTGQVDVREMV